MITVCAHCEKLGYRNILDVDGVLYDRVSHGACRLSELEAYERLDNFIDGEKEELERLRISEGY